jgi:hypothetical protein
MSTVSSVSTNSTSLAKAGRQIKVSILLSPNNSMSTVSSVSTNSTSLAKAERQIKVSILTLLYIYLISCIFNFQYCDIFSDKLYFGTDPIKNIANPCDFNSAKGLFNSL